MAFFGLIKEKKIDEQQESIVAEKKIDEQQESIVDAVDNVSKNFTPVMVTTYREEDIFGLNLKTWQNAVSEAWSELNPSRTELAIVYRAMMNYDSQVITCMQQRKLKSLQGSIALYGADGKVDEESTKLIKTPSGSTKSWVRDVIEGCLDSIFYGFVLKQLTIEKNKFTSEDEVKIKNIPYSNLIPEQHAILKDTLLGSHYDSNKIYYDKGALDFATIKINYGNDIRNLGLLNSCSPYFFSKALSSWKMHSDKHAMLTRVLKTDSENAEKMKAAYNALKNNMRSSLIVLSQSDSLEFEGDTRANPHMIYSDLNKHCDDNIAKIILGQTSTTDQKSFVGSAEVHENVLESIVRSDREFIEQIMNEQVLPKLKLLGVIKKDVYFGVSENANIDLVKMAGIIETLSKAGYQAETEYVEKTFDIPIITNNNNKNKENNNG